MSDNLISNGVGGTLTPSAGLGSSFGSSAFIPASAGRLALRMRTVPGGVVGGVTMDVEAVGAT